MVAAFWLTSHNFGDNLNHYLLSRIARGGVVFTAIDAPETKVVAIGTILNWCDETCIAWGAGLGDQTHFANPAAEVRATRGPLTARRARECGLSVPDVYGDPALLMPMIYRPPSLRRFEVGLIPHYVDQSTVYRAYADASQEVRLIDILDTPERVIDAIASCDVVASSSLHGLIVAHAYGVGAAWVRFSDKIGGDGMKYHDYRMSVGLGAIEVANCDDFPPISTLISRCEDQWAEKAEFDPEPLIAAAPFELAPGWPKSMATLS